MTTKRKAIRVQAHEKKALIHLYLSAAIPIDQFEQRVEELAQLNRDWKKITGRQDSNQDLLHYMRSQRKQGKWVKLNGKHTKKPTAMEFSAEETEILVALFESNLADCELGSDNLAYDAELAAAMAKEFSIEIGRFVPPHELVTKLTAIRKRGLLPKVVKSEDDDEEIGFGDIEQVTA